MKLIVLLSGCTAGHITSYIVVMAIPIFVIITETQFVVFAETLCYNEIN